MDAQVSYGEQIAVTIDDLIYNVEVVKKPLGVSYAESEVEYVDRKLENGLSVFSEQQIVQWKELLSTLNIEPTPEIE